MNTSKQINVMIGLLFIGALGTLLYFVWDNTRESAANDRQLQVNAERGGKLFSLNCRACHGLHGLGALESAALPGLPLNTDDNRQADKARQDYLRATIKCGRVGTKMPQWASENGGSLNPFQIEQLVALITGTMNDPQGNSAFDQNAQASVDGWHNAVAEADHSDLFSPEKHLAEATSVDATTLVLDNARSLRVGGNLRLDENPDDQAYEVVAVVDAPADSALKEDITKDATEIELDDATVFKPGDTIIIGSEQLKAINSPARSVLAKDVAKDAISVEVQDNRAFKAGKFVTVGVEKMQITAVTGNTLSVKRGADETEPSDHSADSAIFETGVADKLAQDAANDATKLTVKDGTGFANGQVVQVDREKMLVTSVSGNDLEVQRAQNNTVAKKHSSGANINQITNVLKVQRAVEGTEADSHDIKTQVFETGNTVTVKRGAFSTKAAEHPSGTEVYNGPITPPDAITGSGTGNPPCGQKAPAATATPGASAAPAAEVPASGSANVDLGDNFFDVGGNHNPTFKVAAGSAVTFNLTNNGKAPHNMRVAGADGQFETPDDSVSNPDVINAGATATLAFTGPAGTYDYRCDFHPDQMHGQIKAE